MLSIKDIAELLVKQFNAYAERNEYGKELAIYDNFATAAYDYRIVNSDEIVTAKQYGIIRNQSSQIGTVGGLQTVSGNMTIDILVDITEEGNDGQFPEVDALVDLINGFAMQYVGKYINAVADGSNYAVLPLISAATVGFYQEDSSNWGAYVPVSFSLAFTALQNGMSSSAIGIEIDGCRIYCDTLVLTRVKTSSSDVKSSENSGVTRVADDSTTFEVEFTAPFQRDNKVCEELLDETLDGRSNAPHLVEIIREQNDLSKKYIACFMMSIAKAQTTVSSGALVGINANLLELDGDTAEDDESLPFHNPRWHGVTVTAVDGVGSFTVPAGSYCVFWGDGSGEYQSVSSTSAISHAYKRDGAYTVRYFERG